MVVMRLRTSSSVQVAGISTFKLSVTLASPDEITVL